MKGNFGKRIFRNLFVRACARPPTCPSVQKPTALESVDFALPKMRGYKKRHSIISTVFPFKSVDPVSQKGVATKKSLPPVKAFLFFVKFTAAIFPAASPQRGLTSIFPAVSPQRGLTSNTAGINSVRTRQKAREFFPTPFFWFSFVKGDFEKHIFQNLSVRACVRPSVQKPISLESVDFASPKMVGSKKREIPLL